MRRMLVPAASVLALTAFAATPAAAIDCQGNFQVQKNGDPIATPFCADGYLAIVAREYGMNVSAQGIRYNPSIKEQACRFVGDDIRVRDTCTNYRNDDERNWR